MERTLGSGWISARIISKSSTYPSVCGLQRPRCTWRKNAAKWVQAYKLKGGLGDWNSFVAAVDEKFGAYDYRKALQDLLTVRQEGFVEEYTKDFEAI
jgi:hypothetical protein